ncbi:TPA: hypothetical protein DEP58_00095 [Patescibacteria group bacterium]|nr:MAG: hypothetical protein UU98_C0002G0036 [Parcubacteria group bacterium GW2011_GWD2_42_14]HCC04691.1 hypothetical protein [Patescibacteria group bacterium]
MKRIFVFVTLAVFMFVSFGCNQTYASSRNYYNSQQYQVKRYQHQQYRHQSQPRHHRHHHSNRNVAIALGAIALTTVALSQNRQPVNRGYTERDLQHQQANIAYQECLRDRNTDLRYGVPPQKAKDCRRLDPKNMNWSRK